MEGICGCEGEDVFVDGGVRESVYPGPADQLPALEVEGGGRGED